MIMIGNVIVEEDVYRQHFVCHIEKCKGACCIEGDFGAPLEAEEIDILKNIYRQISDFLEPESVTFLEENGPTQDYEDGQITGTPIHEDGRCAYAVFNQDGSIGCGIEHAWKAGQIDFQKPVSCHLYPIRIKKHPTNNMEMMTYERWNICTPACGHGQNLGVSLFEFSRDSIRRKYGEEFLIQLTDAVEREKKQENI